MRQARALIGMFGVIAALVITASWAFRAYIDLVVWISRC